MDDAKPGRFGYVHIEEKLARLRREQGLGAEFGRREMLRALGRAFGAQEALLLERGFDRAYRRVVEGV